MKDTGICKLCGKKIDSYDARMVYKTSDGSELLNFCMAHEDDTKISEIINITEAKIGVKEDLTECFKVLKYEKITVEYIKFLGKVCTYYGYTIDDLKEKLILNKDDMERLKQ